MPSHAEWFDLRSSSRILICDCLGFPKPGDLVPKVNIPRDNQEKLPCLLASEILFYHLCQSSVARYICYAI